MSHQPVRYSEGFKRKVVSELEAGKWPCRSAAMAAYGITGNDTLARWTRRYGNPSLHPRRILVMNPKEESELERLRRRNRELEQALAQTQVDSVINQAYLDVACREFGIEDVEAFKKSLATKRLAPPDREPPG